jgi:ribosome biogenesis protein Tsr3
MNYISESYKWRNAMLSINVEDLNTYHDSCAGITKIQVITKTWDPIIGPAVTRGEVHEA